MMILENTTGVMWFFRITQRDLSRRQKKVSFGSDFLSAKDFQNVY